MEDVKERTREENEERERKAAGDRSEEGFCGCGGVGY